jgi:hypothetical protein
MRKVYVLGLLQEACNKIVPIIKWMNSRNGKAMINMLLRLMIL